MIKNDMKQNDKPTYTLWNGSDMVATYPHTREGSDEAFARAYGMQVGGYAVGTLAIYSSRDDLVWSSSDEGDESPTTEEMSHLDSVYDDADTLSGGGWPGDGSGVDDLADFNAMEGCDY
jgi:hypothetical protein